MELIEYLEKIINGKQPNINISNVDDNLLKIKLKNNINKSIVFLDFDFDDYFDLFDLDDYSRYYINVATNNYYGGELIDYYNAQNEWDEGYLLNNFNDENIKLVNDILFLTNPNLMNFNINNQQSRNLFSATVAEFLNDTFPTEIGNIISDYHSEMTNSAEKSINDLITEIYCNPFESYGLFTYNCYGGYYTTIKHLLLLLKKFNVNSIKDLLLEIIEAEDLKDTYLEDYISDAIYSNKYFDDIKFNNDVEWQLEKIIENINENPEIINNIKFIDYVKDNILSKFKLNNKYNLNNNRGQFAITKIDIPKQRIVLTHFKENSKENKSYSIDEFNTFLSSPELFESVRRYIKKYLK